VNDWFDGDRGNALVDVVEMMSEGADVNLFRCVQSGALISVGMTRDGGAVSVTVTLDGKWRREYFHDANQLTLWSEAAAEAVAVSRGVDAAPATPPPTRRRAKR
jgi:hypothetical protein